MTLPRYSTVKVRPIGLDGRGSLTRQTYSSTGRSTYLAANSWGVSTPSRWKFLSLSVHCQSKRCGGADSSRALAQLIAEDRVHPGRVRRALRFRHVALGNQAVLGHQSGEHVPLAAVAGHRLKQEGDGAVVDVAA